MEKWDQDYRDLVVPAFIEFSGNRQGEFQFGTVHGWLDWRAGERDGSGAAEFSWEGEDDDDRGSGRGWAVVDGELMRGKIFVHLGEDSTFSARRESGVRVHGDVTRVSQP